MKTMLLAPIGMLIAFGIFVSTQSPKLERVR